MKKLLILSLFASLPTFAASQKEIDNTAIITCNIIKSTSMFQSTIRLKEMNVARTKIGADPFLGDDATIIEAVRFGLCETLVKDDDLYASKIVEAKNKKTAEELAQRLALEEANLQKRKENERIRLEEAKVAQELKMELEKEAEVERQRQRELAAAEAKLTREGERIAAKRLSEFNPIFSVHPNISIPYWEQYFQCFDLPKKPLNVTLVVQGKKFSQELSKEVVSREKAPNAQKVGASGPRCRIRTRLPSSKLVTKILGDTVASVNSSGHAHHTLHSNLYRLRVCYVDRVIDHCPEMTDIERLLN